MRSGSSLSELAKSATEGNLLCCRVPQRCTRRLATLTIHGAVAWCARGKAETSKIMGIDSTYRPVAIVGPYEALDGLQSAVPPKCENRL